MSLTFWRYYLKANGPHNYHLSLSENTPKAQCVYHRVSHIFLIRWPIRWVYLASLEVTGSHWKSSSVSALRLRRGIDVHLQVQELLYLGTA